VSFVEKVLKLVSKGLIGSEEEALYNLNELRYAALRYINRI